MKVVFKNKYNEKIDIGNEKTEDACLALIKNYAESIGYKVYYMRTSERNDHIWVDFGSHSEFCYIYLTD